MSCGEECQTYCNQVCPFLAIWDCTFKDTTNAYCALFGNAANSMCLSIGSGFDCDKLTPCVTPYLACMEKSIPLIPTTQDLCLGMLNICMENHGKP